VRPSALPAALRRDLSGFACLGGARALAALCGFAAVVLLARGLGPYEFGVWSLLLAVHGYALQFGELGLRSVLTAEAGAAPPRARALLPSYLALRTAASILAWLVALAVTALQAPAFLVPVALVFASLLPAALQFDWIPLARGRAFLAAFLFLARPTGFLLLLLPWALLGGDLRQLALLYLLGWTLAAAAALPALRLLPERGVPPARPARILLRRGLPLCVTNLSSQAQYTLDLLVAGAVLGAAAVGEFYLAHAIAMAGLVFANAAGQLALARMSPLARRPAAFGLRLRGELRVVTVTALSLGAAMILVAPWLVPLAFGDAYPRTPLLLVWLLPWFLLQHLTTLLQGTLAAVGRERRVLAGNLAMLAVLVPGLAVAAWIGDLRGFAAARALAELARLLTLHRAVRGPLACADEAPREGRKTVPLPSP